MSGQRIVVREETATDNVLTYLHGDHLGSASLATWGQTEPTVLNRHLYLPLVLRGYEQPVVQTTPLGATPLFSPLVLPTCDSPLPAPEPPARASAEPEALAVASFDPPADRVAGDVVPGSNLRYTPFGEVRTGNQEGLLTDRLYTGQRWDVSIGLYDYNARHYVPALGRFVQADTIVPELGNPQSLNRYAYVLNNPVKYVDPTGHAYCVDPDCSFVANPVSGQVLQHQPTHTDAVFGGKDFLIENHTFAYTGINPFFINGWISAAKLQQVSDEYGVPGELIAVVLQLENNPRFGILGVIRRAVKIRMVPYL